MDVTVNRNLRCPSWRSGDKRVEVFETVDITTEIARVEAEDSDDEVTNWPLTMPNSSDKMNKSIWSLTLGASFNIKHTHTIPLGTFPSFSFVEN